MRTELGVQAYSKHQHLYYKTVQIVYSVTMLTTSTCCNYKSWHSSQRFVDCILSSTITITHVNVLIRWFYWVCSSNHFWNFSKVLLGKPEGRRLLGRPRRRWVDNIRMDLQEVGCGYMDWIGLTQDRDRWRTLVSAVMNLRVPWNTENFLTSCKPVSFARRILHHGISK